MEPINFEVEKRYSPNFDKIQKLESGEIGPDELRQIQLPEETINLAKQSILMRLKELTILDWNAKFRALGFGESTDILVVTIVVDGESSKPYQVELKGFSNVKRGQSLSIGKWGVAMYQKTGIVPTYLDMRVLVARNRENIRNLGQALQDVSSNTDFQSAVKLLSTLVAGPMGVITSQVDKIIGIIGAILKLKKDDQLLYYAATLHRDFDRLGVGLTCDNTDFVKLCYEVQVGEQKESIDT